jgi:predicted ATPase
MSDPRTHPDLHIPDLSITGFRGIARLSIARLGRVTLLTGRNGAGKTTVLEAVRVYAARARPNVLHDVLERREELATALDEDQDPVVFPDYAALFHGRVGTHGQSITIGPAGGKDDLRIEVSTLPAQQSLFADQPARMQAIKIEYRRKERLLPWFLPASERNRSWARRRYVWDLHRAWRTDDTEWPIIECESLGPGLPSNDRIARLWDNVTLTDAEDLSIDALRLIGDDIDRVAVVSDDQRSRRRRVVVKLKNQARPVPLKSLGDGVPRMFAAGLALANSRDGFLVVDEAENGFHHSVQRDFWRTVLRAAQQNNVQVLATTHSWDCVRGFAQAATEIGDVAGALVRLDRDGEELRSVEYSEEDLETIAEQGIEVR